jgi:hypothetical protein
MGFLTAYEGTRTIDVGAAGSGYWVELRECLSQGDKEDAERALSAGKVVDGKRFEMTMDTARYRQLMVLASVKAWNLDDDDTGVWPVNLSNVRRLPGPVFDQIWTVVDELNAPAPTEDRKRFPGGGGGGDQDGDGGTGDVGQLPDGTGNQHPVGRKPRRIPA